MSTMTMAFPFALMKFYELTRFPLLQVETENGGLTWWGALLLLGLVILVVIWAFARNASKTSMPEDEHSTHEMHPDVVPAPAHSHLADDLTRIEGIGPKIASLLKENGIATFEQLRHANLTSLRTILEDARLQFADPGSWPEQAALAAKADWESLAALQADLKGGRR